MMKKKNTLEEMFKMKKRKKGEEKNHAWSQRKRDRVEVVRVELKRERVSADALEAASCDEDLAQTRLDLPPERSESDRHSEERVKSHKVPSLRIALELSLIPRPFTAVLRSHSSRSVFPSRRWPARRPPSVLRRARARGGTNSRTCASGAAACPRRLRRQRSRERERERERESLAQFRNEAESPLVPEWPRAGLGLNECEKKKRESAPPLAELSPGHDADLPPPLSSVLDSHIVLFSTLVPRTEVGVSIRKSDARSEKPHTDSVDRAHTSSPSISTRSSRDSRKGLYSPRSGHKAPTSDARTQRLRLLHRVRRQHHRATRLRWIYIYTHRV